MQGYLPYRIWVPYDTDTSPMFLITSIQQIITVVFVTIINVGTETLVFGLFLQTCAQFEIFENRLRKLISNKIAKYLKPASSNKKRAIISEYIYHHLSIYKLVILESIFYALLSVNPIVYILKYINLLNIISKISQSIF